MEDARYGGLTQKEVKERINAGKTNQSDASTGLTVKQIILSNTLTYFNLIFLVITVLLCIVGSFRNLTFCRLFCGTSSSESFRNGVQKKRLTK